MVAIERGNKMKKLVITLILGLILSLILCGCNMTTPPPETPSETPAEQHTEETKPEFQEVVSVLDLAKEEVHNKLFRERTDTTQKIVNRLFKNMEYTVISSEVDGDEATVTMWIMNINAGNAWERTLEKYAELSVGNMLTDKRVSPEDLYLEYLDELEDSFRAADMIIIPVVVEMDLENYQWIWDFDDNVINAITGNLLAAIEGDLDDLRHFYISPKELEEWVWEINAVIEMFNGRDELNTPTEGDYIMMHPDLLKSE
jgi:hypothetical protein